MDIALYIGYILRASFSLSVYLSTKGNDEPGSVHSYTSNCNNTPFYCLLLFFWLRPSSQASTTNQVALSLSLSLILYNVLWPLQL